MSTQEEDEADRQAEIPFEIDSTLCRIEELLKEILEIIKRGKQ